MRAVELDGAPVDASFVASMETCVQCRGCEAACPSSVPFGHLMEGTRDALASFSTGHRPSVVRRALEWLALDVVLVRHRLLLAMTWLLWAGQRLHLLPRRFGIPRLRRASLRAPLEGDAAATVVLFPGCVMDAWQRDVHRAAMPRAAVDRRSRRAAARGG